MAQSIPITVAKAIKPDLYDPVSYSHMYTVQEFRPKSFGQYVIRLPYTPNLFWTQFRVIWTGLHDVQACLSWRSSEQTTDIHLPCVATCKTNVWNEFQWPLPSVHTKEDAGFYLTIEFPKEVFNAILQVDILGFEQLLPYHVRNIELCDIDGTPNWLLTSYDYKYRYYYIQEAQNKRDEDGTMYAKVYPIEYYKIRQSKT